MRNNGRLFGTDGIRGRANAGLTPDLAFGLARAAGESSQGTVVIGRDPRRSSPMFASALQAGFNSVGVDTIDLGILPVGAVSRLLRDTGSRLGVMVSASHNPAEDNGIKFFGPDGAKLSDEREDEIEARYLKGEPWVTALGPAVGMQSIMADAIDRYVDKVSRTVEYSMRGLEFAVDCANGAAFLTAPALFRKVGATVHVYGDQPDGTNINERCGALHPSFLAKRAEGRVGLAFDGDADRLIAIDEDGQPVNGDVLMAIFAEFLMERSKLKNDLVVVTVMSNLGFHEAMRRLGVEVIETKVGDRYVLEEMRRTRAVLGGEQSGHILLEDRATGDGLRTALRLMEVLAATGRELRDLRKVMNEYPQVLQNIAVADKEAFTGNEVVAEAIRDGERTLSGRGRILVRASGTEPVIRIMVEARSESEASAVATQISDVVMAELG